MRRALFSLALLLLAPACASFTRLDLRPNGPPRDYHSSEAPLATRTPGRVRFFAVGDAGEGDANQPSGVAPGAKAVAIGVRRACEEKGGCDFGVFLGDNIYPRGIDAIGDGSHRLFEAFVRSYAAVSPLFFVLGNHDWGPGLIPYGASPTSERADRELAVVAACPSCRGAAHFYDVTAGPLQLFAWDTNYLVHRCDIEDGRAACEMDGIDALGGVARSGAPFRVVVGHHPYFSNGSHGDAGSFEDFLSFSIGSGSGLRKLMDDHVIGVADLYLAGHDHNLQVFAGAGTTPETPAVDPLRGTAVLVSGAGAKRTKLRDPEDRTHQARYECDRDLGFTMVEATADELRVEIYAVADPGKREGVFLVPPPRRVFAMVKKKEAKGFEVEGSPARCSP
jgi:tartrate-resistant acid phosphatase type 5